MAAVKPIGEFSLKMVTLTTSPGPAGSPLIQANWEGTATGFGTIFGTANYAGNPPKGGTFSWCSLAYLDDGNALSGIGQGTYENIGKHRWRTEGFFQISDGRRLTAEGEVDLASRSWKGKLSEMN
jgi:hypothetical protein